MVDIADLAKANLLMRLSLIRVVQKSTGSTPATGDCLRSVLKEIYFVSILTQPDM